MYTYVVNRIAIVLHVFLFKLLIFFFFLHLLTIVFLCRGCLRNVWLSKKSFFQRVHLLSWFWKESKKNIFSITVCKILQKRCGHSNIDLALIYAGTRFRKPASCVHFTHHIQVALDVQSTAGVSIFLTILQTQIASAVHFPAPDHVVLQYHLISCCAFCKSNTCTTFVFQCDFSPFK